MRVLFSCLLFAATLGFATQAAAQSCGDNACTTIVLHAIDTAFQPCDPAPIDCAAGGTTATVDATGFGALVVSMLVANFDDLQGVQCAFEWDPSWVFTFGLWDCQVSQLAAVTPANPGGATAGTISTAFNALTGPANAAHIGRLNFATAPTTGCIGLVESTFVNGNHVVPDGGVPPTSVIMENWGRVCVGAGGRDTCVPVVAVEPTTWGSIKAQYN